MKLQNLLNTSIQEDATPSSTLTAQGTHLLSLLEKALDAIPPEIEHDFSNETVDYPSRLFLDAKSTLFDSTGRCMVESIDDIYHYAKSEKVILEVGGYDGDYEEFFVTPKSAEMLVKRMPEKDGEEQVSVKFDSSSFQLTRTEFESVLEKFVDHYRASYERIKDRKSSSDYYDDEDYRPRRRSWHNEYPNEWDDPEPSENDFNYTTSKIYGGLIYKNLHHV